MDALGYIFDLIDIEQKDNKPVVSLKAHFSQSFSSLKLGGIAIDSALQVGFHALYPFGLLACSGSEVLPQPPSPKRSKPSDSCGPMC